MDTRIRVAESLHCSPATITALFVNQLYPNIEQRVKKNTIMQKKEKKNNSVSHVKQLSSALFYFSYMCRVYWLQCKKKYFFVCITVGKKSGRECFKERIKSFTPCHSVPDWSELIESVRPPHLPEASTGHKPTNQPGASAFSILIPS